MKNFILLAFAIFLSSCSSEDDIHRYHQFRMKTDLEYTYADYNGSNVLNIKLSENTSIGTGKYLMKIEYIEKNTEISEISKDGTPIVVGEYFPVELGDIQFKLTNSPGVNKILISVKNLNDNQIETLTMQYGSAPEGVFFDGYGEQNMGPLSPVNLYYNTPHTSGKNYLSFEVAAPTINDRNIFIYYNNQYYRQGEKVAIENMKNIKLEFNRGYNNGAMLNIIFKIENEDGTIYTTPIVKPLYY